MLALTAGFLFFAGCGRESTHDLSSPEKLAYLEHAGADSRIMITTPAGGDGQSLLEWQQSGERYGFTNNGRYFSVKRPPESTDEEKQRFSFSTDGRYFVVPLEQQSGSGQLLVISTDGSVAWLLPAGNKPVFSSDSAKVAFYTHKEGEAPAGISIIDTATGKTRAVASGNYLSNPVWIDNNSLVYSNEEDGGIYEADLITGKNTLLTPPNRHFLLQGPSASYAQDKVALVERDPNFDIWSLDLLRGGFQQITNNRRFFHFAAGYLPGTNEILFEQRDQLDLPDSAELCLMGDDGRNFTILTSNFSFDGLFAVSSDGKEIAYQNSNEAVTSVLDLNISEPGGRRLIVHGDASRWVGDPGFASVEDWNTENLLNIKLADDCGRYCAAWVSNPSDHEVEGVLRAFPGADIRIAPKDGTAPGSNSAGDWPKDGEMTRGRQIEWRIKLEPGQSQQFEITTEARPEQKGRLPEDGLLFAAMVTGTPPRMVWRDVK